MRIVVCAKEVLDPDAVNTYAVAGRLEIGDDGRTITQAAIPRLMNAYDEQALEAALCIRDAGVECTITVVSVGADQADVLKQAAAMGADEIAAITIDTSDTSAIDYHVISRLLAAYVKHIDDADLILCGRQASDDDQGVVPALLGEALGMPVVTIARAVEIADEAARVTRVTPDGEEVVEVDLPAVVTISNEIGLPRYPTTAGRIAARRMQATVLSPDDLGLTSDDLQPRVVLSKQFVPQVQGNCEMLSGDSPAQIATDLLERLRADQVLS
jgi:electron transfer flavoprotein beta subunit